MAPAVDCQDMKPAVDNQDMELAVDSADIEPAVDNQDMEPAVDAADTLQAVYEVDTVPAVVEERNIRLVVEKQAIVQAVGRDSVPVGERRVLELVQEQEMPLLLPSEAVEPWEGLMAVPPAVAAGMVGTVGYFRTVAADLDCCRRSFQ